MNRKPLHQLVPIHLGHHHIRERYIERLGRAKCDCVAATMSRLHNVTGVLKSKSEKARYLRFVVNNENSAGYCQCSILQSNAPISGSSARRLPERAVSGQIVGS
jgi:hypothetical protein